MKRSNKAKATWQPLGLLAALAALVAACAPQTIKPRGKGSVALTLDFREALGGTEGQLALDSTVMVPLHIALELRTPEKNLFRQAVNPGQELTLDLPIGDVDVRALVLFERRPSDWETKCQASSGSGGHGQPLLSVSTVLQRVAISDTTEELPIAFGKLESLASRPLLVALPRAGFPTGTVTTSGSAPTPIVYTDALTQSPIIDPCTKKPFRTEANLGLVDLFVPTAPTTQVALRDFAFRPFAPALPSTTAAGTWNWIAADTDILALPAPTANARPSPVLVIPDPKAPALWRLALLPLNGANATPLDSDADGVPNGAELATNENPFIKRFPLELVATADGGTVNVELKVQNPDTLNLGALQSLFRAAMVRTEVIPVGPNPAPQKTEKSLTLSCGAAGCAAQTLFQDLSGTATFNAELLDRWGYATRVPAPTQVVIARPPAIADVGDVITDEDTTLSNIAIAIDDPDGPLDCSTALSANSTNGTLLPSGSMKVSGSSPNCSVSIALAPDQHGVSTVTLTVSDGTLSASDTFILTVNPVNDAPTVASGGDSSKLTPQDTAVAVSLATGSDPDVTTAGQNLSYLFTATPSHGTLSAWPGSATAGGTVTYTPNSGYVGTDSFSYQICDSSTPASCTAAPVTVNLTVSNANEAPTDITLSNTVLSENNPSGALVGNLSTADPDSLLGDSHVYTLAAGDGSADNVSFVIDGNILRLNASANFETKPSYSVRIQTQDLAGTGLTFQKPMTISITDVNEAPTNIDLSATSVPEKTVANFKIGTLTSIDQDAGETAGFALLAGGDAADFSITGSDLVLKNPADYESKSTYSFTVRVTDKGSLSFDKALSIAVTNVNEAPTIADVANQSTSEDTPLNSLAVSIGDPDGALVCGTALSVGTNNATLLPSGGITVGGSYPNCTVSLSPAANQHGLATVTLTVSDGSLSATDTFALTVSPANDAPSVATSGDSSTITAQDTAVAVTLATGTDPDVATAGQTLSYLVSAGPSHGSLSAWPGDATAGGTLTYTPSSGYAGTDSFSYQICDSFTTPSCTTLQTVTLIVTNVNEPPTAITLSSTSIDENAATNAVVGTLSSTDPDLPFGDTHSYSLVAGDGDTDNGAFNINGNELRLNDGADFETKSSYSVRIRSTDSWVLSVESSFTVTINNVAEAPSITSPAAGFLATVNPVGTALTGTCDGGANYVVLEGDVIPGQSTLCSGGQFSFVPWALSAGDDSKTVTVSQTVGGTKRSASVDIYLDATTVPQASAATLDQQFIPGLKATLTGTCDSSGPYTTSATSTIGRVQQVTCAEGALTVLLTDLPEGRNSVTVTTTVTRTSSGDTRDTTETFDQQFFCPQGYVGVPGKFAVESDVPGLGHKNASAAQTDGALNPTRDFCVMKYPAKVATSNNGGQSAWEPVYDGNKGFTTATPPAIAANYWPDSRADSTPWVNITRDQAIDRCKVLNEAFGHCIGSDCFNFNDTVHGFRLMSNTQWQVLARHLESNGANWTGGTVGSGYLWRGHSDGVGDVNRQLLSQVLGSTLSLVSPRSDSGSSDYLGTGNSLSQNTSNTSGWQERRRFVLRNGSSVWDLSGNMLHWVLDNNDSNFGATSTLQSATSAWLEYNTLPSSDQLLLGSAGGYTPAQNAGKILTRSTTASGGAVLRGSSPSYGPNAGLFATDLSRAPTEASTSRGFRCVYLPPLPNSSDTSAPSVSVSRVNGNGSAATNSPVTVGDGGSWNLALTVSDSNNNGDLAPRLRVEVRRKLAASPTDLPTNSDPIYRAGMNHPGLFNKPDTRDLTQQSSVVSLTDGKLYLSNETAWTFDEATGQYTRNDGTYVNYLVTAIDPAGNTTSTTYSVQVTQSCPPGYVGVPGGPDINGLGHVNASMGNSDAGLDPTRAFCVMKYPAKVMSAGTAAAQSFVGGRFEPIVNGNQTFSQDSSGGDAVGYSYTSSTQFDTSIRYLPVSRYAGTPWVNISRDDAVGACRAQQMQYLGSMPDTTAGTGFQLISNTQWQVMARNIEGVATNWSGEAVGSGKLARGHSDNTITSTEILNSWCFGCSGTTPSSAAPNSLNDNNTYFATGPASAFAAWDTLGTTPTTGAEQKRTQALSTGGVVWDVGGNIWQWVLDNNDTNAGNFGASSGLRAGTGTWYEYNDTATLTAGDKLLFGSAGGYTSAQNSGQVFGGSVGAVLRGGRWVSAARTGVFGGALDHGVWTVGASSGFRCVFVPGEPPLIGAMPNQTTNEDVALNGVNFSINAPDGAVGCSSAVIVGATNQELLPPQNISVTGTSPVCTLSLLPAANKNGSTNVTLAASYNGVTSSTTFTLTVQPVNDTPTIKTGGDTSKTFAQDTAASIMLATGSDPDVITNGQTLGYFLATGPNNGTLSPWPSSAISGGNVTYTPNSGYVGADSFSYKICDNSAPTSCSPVQTVWITVSNVNDPPTNIILLDSTVPENAGANAEVGGLFTTDADAGDTFSYSLVSGTGDADNGAFDINGNVLQMKDTANFEDKSSYSVRIQTTDAGGAIFAKALTITITNVNEAPTNISLSNSTVAENSSRVVGTLSATDPDGDTVFTYALGAAAAGNDNGSFTITGTTLSLIAVADYETKDSYNITIRATDAGGLWFENPVTINITNVNDAPTITSLPSSITINEDSSQTVAFQIADIDSVLYCNTTNVPFNTNDAALLPPGNISVTGSTTTLANGGSSASCTATITPSPNMSGSVTVTLTAWDGSLGTNAFFVLNVTDINDAPTLAATPGNNTFNVFQGDTVSVPLVTGTDVDTGSNGTLMYRMVTSPPLKSGTSETLPPDARVGGNLTFTLSETFYGLTSLSYQICDAGLPQLCTSSVPVTLNVQQPAWRRDAYIKAANAGSNDQFGYAVSLSGDTLAVGAFGEDFNGTTIFNGTSAPNVDGSSDFGAVYVYRRSGSSWAQEAYIKATNAGPGDFFGISVAVSGDTLAVGANNEDESGTTIVSGPMTQNSNLAANTGAVYIYNRSGVTWAPQAYIKAANAGTSDLFGGFVSLRGDLLAVGTPAEDANLTTVTNGSLAPSDNSLNDSGAVYLYRRTGSSWSAEAFIKAANAMSEDRFGSSVAVSGDTLAVGATGEKGNSTTITDLTNVTTLAATTDNPGSGAVYVYRRSTSTWAPEAYIKASNAEASDTFGDSVSLSGDTLAVGAPDEDENFTSIITGSAPNWNGKTDSGAVYVYRHSGSSWMQEAYIKAPNANVGDQFGASVTLSGNSLAVGATFVDVNSSTDTGAVYVFDRNTGIWSASGFLKAPNAESQDKFGASVSLSGNTIAVGAPLEDSSNTAIVNGTGTLPINNSATDAGAVYVYRNDTRLFDPDIRVTAVSSTSVTFAWANNLGSNSSQVIVAPAGAGTATPGLCTEFGTTPLPVGTTTYIYGGLTAGTKYGFRFCTTDTTNQTQGTVIWVNTAP